MDSARAETLLPDQKPDGSGVGINYADAMLKPVKLTLDDGRKVAFKRRGLKITLTVGDRSGAGLLRRLEHGPDVKAMFRTALAEAARNAGVAIESSVDGSFTLIAS
jgi:hypothetical protein